MGKGGGGVEGLERGVMRFDGGRTGNSAGGCVAGDGTSGDG